MAKSARKRTTKKAAKPKQPASVKRRTSAEPFMRSSFRTIEGGGLLGAKPRPRNYSSFVDRFSSWVYACAMLNANAIASVPLRLYVSSPNGRKPVRGVRSVPRHRAKYLRGDSKSRPAKSVMQRANLGGDDIQEVLEHPALELLSHPNQYTTGYDFAVLRNLFLQLTGNGYIHPVMAQVGVPTELWIMPAQWTMVIPGKGDDLIDGYVYGRAPNEQRFEVDEVWHQKRPNPRDLFYGMGWVEAACRSIDLLGSMDEYELALFDNMARPDWGIFITERLTDPQWERLMGHIDTNLRGRKKTGKPYVFEGGADAKPLQFSPRDLAFADGMERMVEAVCACSGVPVTKLLTKDSTFNNVEMGDYGWMKDTIQPYCMQDEEFLNNNFLSLYDRFDEGLFFAYDNPVPSDEERDSRVHTAYANAAVLTIDEIRSELGYEAVEGGNVPRFNGSKLDQPMLGSGVFGSGFSQQQDEKPRREEEAEPPQDGEKQLRASLEHAKVNDEPISHKLLWMASVRSTKSEPPNPSIPEDEVQKLRAAVGEIINDVSRRVTERFMATGTSEAAAIASSEELVRAAIQPLKTAVESFIVRGGTIGSASLPTAISFDAASPGVQRFVDQYTVRLATELNGQTEIELRELISNGLEQGESIGKVVRRIEDYASDATRTRAELIARTESARAYSGGKEMAWSESGVVMGKKWLLAPGACPFCVEAARQVNEKVTPLNEPFFRMGTTIVAGGRAMVLDYQDVMGPPLHPNDRCDMVPVLIQREGGQ